MSFVTTSQEASSGHQPLHSQGTSKEEEEEEEAAAAAETTSTRRDDSLSLSGSDRLTIATAMDMDSERKQGGEATPRDAAGVSASS